jgi:hypothetical protein
MPAIFYPASVEAALKAEPVFPRLINWYEAPLHAAGIALPLTLLGSFWLSWLARGPVATALFFLAHLFLSVFVLKLGSVVGLHTLSKTMSRMAGRTRSALAWTREAWHRNDVLRLLQQTPLGAAV